jgi:phosphatidylinositol alpha-mannosyltransferase
MKIAQVSPYDYTYPGGVVAHISHLKHYLSLLGHEVKIIAPCSANRQTYLNETVIAMGRPFPIPSSGSMARIPLSPWLMKRMEDLLRAERFDIIHIHEPFTPVLAVAAMLKSRSVNVGTFHAYHSKARGYWVTKPLLTRWLPLLHGKIAVSKPALDFVSRHLPADYVIIPNGIDVARFSPDVPPIEELRDGKFNILFVGRLEKRKGFESLLKAYGQVKRRFPDVRLIVVGPGTRLRVRYENEVRSDGLKDILFVGYVPQEDLPRYYASADVFCAPATGQESFGIVLLEAMACGKPVIATRIEGYASLMTDQVEGILVPPRDSEALGKAISSVISNPALAQEMGRNGRKKAETYSWQHIAQRIADLYSDLLARN